MYTVITGGAGSLAADIIPDLVGRGHHVRAVDQRPVSEHTQRLAAEEGARSGGSLTTVATDLSILTDPEKVFAEASAVIHLAGIPLEDEWHAVLQANIDLTERVLGLSNQFAVPRFVYASSIHAVGFTPIPRRGELLAPTIEVNPNTYYGASKAAGEALCRYFANTTDLQVLNVRVCSRFALPRDSRMLSTWLSPGDAAELFHQGCTHAIPESYWSVWGVSANTRTWFDAYPGELVGFKPQDDAEAHIESLPAHSWLESSTPAGTTIGGQFSSTNPPRMKG